MMLEIKQQLFRFYPYVLLLSSLFLCATLIVYTAFPKLLNHYTRVMRHFTFTMMISFVNLAINQLVSLVDSNPIMCKVFGNYIITRFKT